MKANLREEIKAELPCSMNRRAEKKSRKRRRRTRSTGRRQEPLHDLSRGIARARRTRRRVNQLALFSPLGWFFVVVIGVVLLAFGIQVPWWIIIVASLVAIEDIVSWVAGGS